ncbi:MAG TPA: HAD family hydrolase, partial [Armatimonadota bacterium]|nr:HAD family hydrolase [Armatimonadota bacterium]
MPIRALFFDLDDTLLESHNAHQEAVRRSCRRAAELHSGWTEQQFLEAFFTAYRTLEVQIESGQLQLDSHLLFRTRVWEEALRQSGLDPAVGEELALSYLEERRKRYQLYPEVPGLLDRLAPRYRLVLVTNGIGGMQREK